MERVTITPVGRPIKGTQPGEPLEISRKEARVLIAIKRAVLYEPKVVQPEPVQEPDAESRPVRKRRKRTYKRRDMESED